VKTKQDYFWGLDGARLFYQLYEPNVQARATVIVVHGHGDHSGGLVRVCEKLTENGYIACALDLRGHGKSPGTRGYIRSWGQFRGDLHAFRERVDQLYPKLPRFILSHSLGGVISIDYCLHHGKGIQGLIAIAPAISYKVKFVERLFVSLVGLIKSDLMIVKKGKPSLLTQDKIILEKLNADQLRHTIVTPGLGRGLIKIVPQILKKAGKIQTPFLMQIGMDDVVTPPSKLRNFFEVVGSSDKEMIEYKNTRHRPFDDLIREQFFEDLFSWLDKHG
jgi:alpha-beta hydrolase superfamily lysophospholipase